ncbi:tRNA (adenosine(37)-N6)-threonylcarbamoyltransferase complex dimerization subunit type 1 TsaB [Candidatus Saccharibacteria bacterium CG_4_10_14_0_2_um_filter_52_9]|nr:MAG: tRNA (adenosine(37)-N6)-threonylcarbamoyltransferase complex dimerization subunit type 1 TsaB [Candidatus Saccharibacteria bacterium CG_4_10_14_0_2_um_filter_52_9]
MLTLTIRTDNPQAELGLYQDGKRLAFTTWEAHRQLAETIHFKIKQLLETEQLSLKDLKGIMIYEGPGSFTGLRIGASVANALAYALNIDVVGATGKDWTASGVKVLASGKAGQYAVPNYGAPARTTTQKK